MNQKPKIIICTERGKLEKYALLFCRSLREFGGLWSDVEIHSFAPRKGFEPRKSTLDEFDKLGVKHQNIELNKDYRAYPLANKPLVCSYAEHLLPNQEIIFIDSDQVVFNDISLLKLENGHEVLVRPVDKKGVAFSSTMDKEFTYWEELRKHIDFNPRGHAKVKTSLGEEIFPYFNSGLILTNTKFGLFQKWKENFELIWDKQIFPKSGMFFLEQSLFTATILQMKLNYGILNLGCNYPFSLHNKIADEFKINDLELIVTAHYHDLLVWKNHPDYFSAFLKSTKKGEWLKNQMEDLKIKPDSMAQSYIGRIKKKLLK